MSLETELSKKKGPRLPVLGEYTNSREYLKDFYHYKQYQTLSSLRPYCYAHFSAAADIKSPNYLKLVIEGQRNLSATMITKFSKALGLNKKQREEFEALVKYTQANEPLERNRRLKELSDIRVKSSIEDGQINKDDFNRVSSWVSWALIGLAETRQTEPFDVEKTHTLLKQRATKVEIKKCLDQLIEAQVLRLNDNGFLEKTGRQMKDADKIPPELVRKLQAQLMYLGLESLFNDDPKDREFGTQTLSLTEKEYQQLKFEIRHFRKKIYSQILLQREQEGPGEKVFQLNFQLFPLSE